MQSTRRRSLVYRDFDIPGRCVPVPHPSSVIRDANGNRSVYGRGLLPRCDCCAFFAAHRSGPFPPATPTLRSHVRLRARIRKPNLAEGAALARRKGFPQSSALRLCRPSLRLPSALLRVGDTPPLRLAAPPSPGGVRHVGTCHAWHEKQTQRRQTP